MILVVVLIGISLMISDIDLLFMYLLTLFIYSSDKDLFRPFVHFCDWVVWFFDIDYLFVFTLTIIVCFAVQKVFNLIYSITCLFLLWVVFDLGVKFRKSFPDQHQGAYLQFSFGSFIILGFKSLAKHFEFDCCVWSKMKIQIYSFQFDYLVYPTLFAEESILSPLYILGSFMKNHLAIYVWISFWALYSFLLISCLFYEKSILFWLLYLWIYFEIRKCDVSWFFFLFKIALMK